MIRAGGYGELAERMPSSFPSLEARPLGGLVGDHAWWPFKNGSDSELSSSSSSFFFHAGGWSTIQAMAIGNGDRRRPTVLLYEPTKNLRPFRGKLGILVHRIEREGPWPFGTSLLKLARFMSKLPLIYTILQRAGMNLIEEKKKYCYAIGILEYSFSHQNF